ncbi:MULTISPECIES: TetR/AcrR family transcriptional regulator [Streptosporangium]|uniref:AcrR family transcriptional regulator n=1 Tax=Streptosporangium brasiliense TaxID=47480 RepID=A0ABT9REE5_9ACTN|nr:TetR/AcrR family transcriptional regulator [Streptosporangium brasiliense]MDP9867630.1 AcrR family transcriptional regulator [Streptosporangium brasiliense]
MQDGSHLESKRRPGGRTARNRAAVLDATLAELVEHGYAETSMEKIAMRAGVATSTVYRRWTNLEGVIQDLAHRFADDAGVPNGGESFPDSGDLETDLRALAGAFLTIYAHVAQRVWLDVMVAAAVRDPAARETLSAVVASRIRETSLLVRRAIDRGEVPADTDAEEVIRMVAAPFYYRMLVTAEPIDSALADRVAAMAAHAARAGILVRRATPPEQ